MGSESNIEGALHEQARREQALLHPKAELAYIQ